MQISSKPRLAVSALAVALVLAGAAWQVRTAQRMPADSLAFPALNSSLEPLRAEFNHDAGRVRLVMLIDPT